MSNTAYKEYISKLETLFDTAVKSNADGYYEGERNIAGLPHGFGTMHYAKSDKNKREKYTGEWKNGKRHGKGELVSTTGQSYHGDWQDDKRHGNGKFILSDGGFYDVEWKSGKKNGKGIWTDKDGLSCDGEWEEDKLINSTDWQYGGSLAVKIGEQIWMTKNLDVEIFRNGDPIPHITSDEEWEEYGNQGKPAWCYYDNRKANGEKYGKLYNWYAVNDPRGLAPKGWKVPSIDEWRELVAYLGGDEEAGKSMKTTHGWDDVREEEHDEVKYRKHRKQIEEIEQKISDCKDALRGAYKSKGGLATHATLIVLHLKTGNKLAATGVIEQLEQLLSDLEDDESYIKVSYKSGNGTNLYGFSCLPAGNRSPYGGFDFIGCRGAWRSSTQNDADNAWYLDLWGSKNKTQDGKSSKANGYSVRCLRD